MKGSTRGSLYVPTENMLPIIRWCPHRWHCPSWLVPFNQQSLAHNTNKPMHAHTCHQKAIIMCCPQFTTALGLTMHENPLRHRQRRPWNLVSALFMPRVSNGDVAAATVLYTDSITDLNDAGASLPCDHYVRRTSRCATCPSKTPRVLVQDSSRSARLSFSLRPLFQPNQCAAITCVLHLC